MATLTLKKIKCYKTEDWASDEIQIVVHAASRKVAWKGDMDTGDIKMLGNVAVEFSGSARIQVLEEDWPDGDDDLGSVTVSAGASAAVDYEGKFTQDDANYTVWYRVSTADTTTPVEDGGDYVCEPPSDDPYTEPPVCPSDPDTDDGVTPCPMGQLSVHVKDQDGKPIKGASVRLVQLGRTGTTDNNGNYDFGQVHEGTYRVEASKENYTPNPASTEVTLARATSQVAELTLSTVLMSIKPTADQKWYVNMPADESKHYGRVVTVTAEVTPPTAGVRVYFTLDAKPGNRTSLPAAMRASLSTEAVLTDAHGKAVTKLTLSRYGGDKFRVSASLTQRTPPGTSGALETGWFTVWRKLFYETDCMSRPTGGGTYSNSANHTGLKTSLAKIFVEPVKTGADNSPAHQRVMKDGEVGAWATGLRDGSGQPRYFHLIFLDTIAWDPANQSKTWALPYWQSNITLPGSSYCLDPRNWFVSANYTDTGPGGATGSVPAAKVTLDVDTPNYDAYVLKIDLRGIAGIDPTAHPVNVRVTMKVWNEGSGLQTGPATIIGMRWRERSKAGAALTSSTLNTMLHEPGHAMGLAATKTPAGANIATTYVKDGHHCSYTPRCIMYEANSGATAFCPNCTDAGKGRNLASLPQSGNAAY